MRLTCSQAAKLYRLNAGESLPKSELSASLLPLLQTADVILLEKSGSSYVVRGIPGKLASFVEHHWGIRDLQGYANAAPTKRNRGLLASVAGDSKALPHRPFGGIFIRSFGNCSLATQPLGFNPSGAATLIALGELDSLEIHAEHLVAVENVECFWRFEKARQYFPELAELQYALVLRWHWGAAWRRWLEKWRGQMFYFPDYDPAGLRIFATEVMPFQPTARLLIPKDFEALLETRGSRGLFLKQEKLFPSFDKDSDIAKLAFSIKKARKAFEQEALLV